MQIKILNFLKRFLFLVCVIYTCNLLNYRVAIAEIKPLSKKDKPKFWVVSGFFDNNGNVHLSPLYTVDDAGSDPPDSLGPYMIELIDKSGSLLATYAFKTDMMHIIKHDGTERHVDSRLFDFVIPFNNCVHELNLKRGSKILYNRKRSPNVPIVSFKKPLANETIRGKINVEWAGFDKDGDNLNYLLEYSKDGCLTWNPISGFFMGNSMPLDTTTMDSSQTTTLGIICSDGFNTSRSEVNVILEMPLKILNTLPSDNDTDVSLEAVVFIIFDSIIKEGDINSRTFLLLERGVDEVPGEVSYESDIDRAAFIPNNKLKPSTSYTVRVVSGIKDIAGNTLKSNYEWSFRTRSLRQ